MTTRAEFFAVTTELFFEKPEALATEHPELYEQFKRYRLDPVAVFRVAGPSDRSAGRIQPVDATH